jgi:hypothetical protein
MFRSLVVGGGPAPLLKALSSRPKTNTFSQIFLVFKSAYIHISIESGDSEYRRL